MVKTSLTAAQLSKRNCQGVCVDLLIQSSSLLDRQRRIFVLIERIVSIYAYGCANDIVITMFNNNNKQFEQKAMIQIA